MKIQVASFIEMSHHDGGQKADVPSSSPSPEKASRAPGLVSNPTALTFEGATDNKEKDGASCCSRRDGAICHKLDRSPRRLPPRIRDERGQVQRRTPRPVQTPGLRRARHPSHGQMARGECETQRGAVPWRVATSSAARARSAASLSVGACLHVWVREGRSKERGACCATP